jgi:hypothetical protein
MEISVAGQAAALTGAAALGLGVGALYDLLRLLRRHMRVRVLGHVLDLLFWAAVTGVLFLYAIAATGGQVRTQPLGPLFRGAFGGWSGQFDPPDLPAGAGPMARCEKN